MYIKGGMFGETVVGKSNEAFDWATLSDTVEQDAYIQFTGGHIAELDYVGVGHNLSITGLTVFTSSVKEAIQGRKKITGLRDNKFTFL